MKHWSHSSIFSKAQWFFSFLLCASLTFAQDAVNPCEILSETLNCSGPGLHGAEIDFKTIKLNGKRKNDPMVSVGEELIIKTAIKYKKRAKAEITTTFNGGCPVRTETKRLKPEVAITYSATLDGTPYNGNGGEFSVNAPLAIGSYPLEVTFTATAVNGCIDNAPLSETKIFVLDVIDGAFILSLDAIKTGTATTVDSGAYLCKGQGQELDLSVTFSDPLNTLPFGANDIVWTVSPPDAGSFSGPSGANGDTVTWLQADEYVSAAEDDVVITVNAPDMQPKSFYLTVFGINSTSGILAVNTTQTFPIEPSDIAPANADLATIVSALSSNTDVGFGTATKLRTRTFTGSSPFNQLENETFLPSEADQTVPSLQIIKKATFMQGTNGLEVEIEAGPVAGDVNITWEQDRPGGTRKILHREHMTVTSGVATGTVTIVLDGTTDEGPVYESVNYSPTLTAIPSSGSFAPGFPIWNIQNTSTTTITQPSPGTVTVPLTDLAPGEYTVEAKIGNTAAQKDTFLIYVYQVDLDVDTNRKDTVTEDDDALEAAWTLASGAIFAVNYDDDDDSTNGVKPDGIGFDSEGNPVDEDTKISNEEDVKDIAPLIIRAVGSTNNIQYFLKIDADDLKAIHIFQKREAGKELLKDSDGDFWSGWTAHKTDTGDQILDITPYVQNQADLDMGIEALFFPGTKINTTPTAYTYDGQVTIEVIAQSGSGNTNLIPANFLASDTVTLRTAPYLLLPNTQKGIDVYIDDHTDADGLEFGFGSGLARRTDPSTESQWFQDHVQIGYTSFPGHVVVEVDETTKKTPPNIVHSTLQVPYKFNLGGVRYHENWPVTDTLKPDSGVFRMRNYYQHDGLSGSGDFGGNLELVPKSDEWPLGRVIVGNNMSAEMQAFLHSQSADGGDAVQKPFTVDVSWLSVGHVDEMIGFAPKGSGEYKVVQADTQLAKDLLDTGAFGISTPAPHTPIFSTPEYLHGTASNQSPTEIKRFLFDGVANGYITCVKVSKIDDGETVTLSDGTDTYIFEFDKDGNFPSATNIKVDLDMLPNNPTSVRDALKTAISNTFFMNSVPIVVTEDGTDSILLFSQVFGTNYNQTITHTVSNNGFEVVGMDGGKVAPGTGPNAGVDFTTDAWALVRLYDGTGHGQVGHIKSRGKGYILLENASPLVFNTSSKLIWNPGDGEDGMYKYASIKNPMPRNTVWFTEPDTTTKYIVTKGSTLWLDGTPSYVPALWTVHELLAEAEMWTFNAEAQAFVDSAVAKIKTEMGMTDGTNPVSFLTDEGDYADDSLTGDSDDDFVSVPTLYMGSRNDTVGGTYYPGLAKGNTFAAVPGFPNFQPVADNKIVFPMPFMARVDQGGSSVDVFEEAARHVIGAGRTVFADVWNGYHRYEGEVHCGSNVRRELFKEAWWTEIQ